MMLWHAAILLLLIQPTTTRGLLTMADLIHIEEAARKSKGNEVLY